MSLFQQTDEQFYLKHPELKGRKLTNSPEDTHYRQEYMQLLNENKKCNSSPSKNAYSTSTCSHKTNVPTNSKPNKNCSVVSISVKKEKESYELKIPGTNLNFKGKLYKDIQTYEIVSGPKARPVTITIKANNVVGPCVETHKGHAFNHIKNEVVLISQTDTELKFKSNALPLDRYNSLFAYIDLVKYFFNDSPILHKVNYSVCGFDNSVIIKIYPALSATLSLSAKYEWSFSKKGSNLTKDKSPTLGLNDKLKYAFKVKYDVDELISIESENKQPDKKNEKTELDQFFDSLADNMKYLNKGLSVFLSDSQTLKLSLKPEISASISSKEVAGKPFVDTEYNVKVGFNPLISMDADVDVSGALLNAIPLVGPFLNAAVSAAEGVKMADVFLGLKIHGSLVYNRVFSKPAGEDIANPKLEFSGSITFDLVGRVVSEHSIYSLQYSIGVVVGAHSGIEVEKTELIKNENGLYIPLSIKFLGITLYYQTWKNIGVAHKSNKFLSDAKKINVSGAGNKELDVNNLEDKQKAVIIDPCILYKGDIYVIGGSSEVKGGATGATGKAGEFDNRQSDYCEEDNYSSEGGYSEPDGGVTYII
jgi:hypothetical protein